MALRYLERLTFRLGLMFPPNEPNGFFELIEMAIVVASFKLRGKWYHFYSLNDLYKDQFGPLSIAEPPVVI